MRNESCATSCHICIHDAVDTILAFHIFHMKLVLSCASVKQIYDIFYGRYTISHNHSVKTNIPSFTSSSVKASIPSLTSPYTSVSQQQLQSAGETTAASANNNMNGGCKIHGPAVLANQLGVGVPMPGNVLGSPSPLGITPAGGCVGATKPRFCPDVIKAFEGVRYIAEVTRREEESVRVSWEVVEGELAE